MLYDVFSTVTFSGSYAKAVMNARQTDSKHQVRETVPRQEAMQFCGGSRVRKQVNFSRLTKSALAKLGVSKLQKESG